jgi:tetratricopeptide (TPR) repeat protein
MWFTHPWGGVGAGAYGDAHPQYQGRVVSASTSAHNFYVQTLAELGIIGAAALAWWLLALLLGVLRGLIRLPANGAPLALGLLALLLHAGLDIDARYPAIVLLAAALAGSLYAGARQSRSKASWAMPLLAVIALFPIVSSYQSDVLAQKAKFNQSEGDYQLAAEQYGRAHATWLYNPDVINAEGINLYTLAAFSPDSSGTLKRALDRARQAQAEDPADGQHHQLEGRILAQQHHPAAAAAAFREALRLDPYNHPDYAQDLANVQLLVGDQAGALQTIQAMLAQYPDAVIANRGNDQTLRPDVANLWATVGNIELRQGNVIAARAAVGRALTIYPASLRGRALKHQVDARQ